MNHKTVQALIDEFNPYRLNFPLLGAGWFISSNIISEILGLLMVFVS